MSPALLGHAQGCVLKAVKSAQGYGTQGCPRCSGLLCLLQQVAKNFREIFAELAPGGRGELVMQKRLRTDPQAEPDPEGEDEQAGPSDRPDAMERYAGVKVKVR